MVLREHLPHHRNDVLLQLDRLRELNCDRAQGFLLARPMSAEALIDLLQEGALLPVA